MILARTIPFCLVLIITLFVTDLLAKPDHGLQSEQIQKAHRLAAKADSLFAEGRWTAAAELYKQAIVFNKEDAGSVYQLGLSYHFAGNLAAAIEAHKQAALYPENCPNSLYNLACAYALNNDKDLAFEAFNSAIDSGIEKKRPLNGRFIQGDSDLDNLRDDPRYQDILRRIYGEGYTGFDGPGPTIQQMREGVYYLAHTIRDKHPNPYRHFSPEEWDNRTQAVIEQIESLDEVSFYVEARELAGMANDVHTSVYPLRSSDVLNASYPLRFWYFDDGIYIRAAAAGFEHLLGAKVLAIQGLPVEQAWDKIMRKMTSENQWMSYYMASFHLQFPAYLHALGLGDSAQGGTWKFLMPNGEAQQVYLKATENSGYLGTIGTSLGIATAPKGWKRAYDTLEQPVLWLKNSNKNYWYEYLEDNRTVFMQFNIPRNAGPSWQTFLDDMFAFIQQNDVEKLIIDLRHNEGGFAYMGQALAQKIIQTAKINTPGHLYVITSRVTQSAGVTISVKLEMETYAIFVGEAGGAHPNFYNGPMGNHPPLALPGTDIVFRVSTESEQNSDPLDNRHYIAPDIATPMTFNDYANGRDTALQAILNFPAEQGKRFFLDSSGKEIPLYFHWQRPTQKEAFK